MRAIMTAKPGVKVILYTDLPPMPPSGEKDDKMVLSSSSEDFSVEVYGSLAPETEAWFSGLGFPVRFFRTALGYPRLLR